MDVEGAEINVLRGATRLLDRVEQFIITFEAHPKVVKRTGVDPVECVRLVNAVRPCAVHVPERPDLGLRLDQPFFAQAPERLVCNIVCRSRG